MTDDEFSTMWNEAHRQNNRRDFPLMARFRDQFDAVFGPCKTIYAEEGGRSIGKLPEGL